MTSKDIIIKLIDSQTITGEEAYVLMNDVLKGEMVAVNEVFKDFNKKSSGTTWVSSPYTITTASAIDAATTTTH